MTQSQLLYKILKASVSINTQSSANYMIVSAEISKVLNQQYFITNRMNKIKSILDACSN
jgi:hypothetical protein